MPRLSQVQRDYITRHAPQLGPTETARRVGCSEKTVRNIMKAEEGAEATTANTMGGREPMSRIEELRELRATLIRALDDAPPQAVAALSRELRATMEEIDQLEGGDEDDASKALAAIAESIAKRMPS